MFVLDPINSITSVNFYRKVAQQSARRTVLYLVYVALLFSVAAATAIKLRVGPALDETFHWLETSVPTLQFSNGKLTSDAPMPVTLRHPDYSDLAVTIDTSRVEPVTPEMLEKDRLAAYVTSNAVYLQQGQGEVRVIDLSKSATNRPVKIDASFFESSRQVLDRALYPVSFALVFLFFLVWKALASLFYSLVAMTINNSAQTRLSYRQLLGIAVYAQTLIVLLQGIFLFMPVGMPAPALVSLILTSVYIWLAVKRTQTPDAPPPAAA